MLAHTTYRRDIDGLRAISIISVVIVHAFPSVLPGGFIGVDIFFVISGFLITGLILRDHARSRFSFWQFYANRGRRIFPALIVVLVTTWISGVVFFTSEELVRLSKELVTASAFVLNIQMAIEGGYFDVEAKLKPLLHLWSLGVEEQFYIIWPLLIILMIKSNYRLITIIILIFSFCINILMIKIHPVATFYSLPTRFWELLMGAILAQSEFARDRWIFNLRETRRGRILANGLTAAALAAILTLAAFWSDAVAFPGWWATIPTLAASVIIAAGPESFINRYALSRSGMVLVGRISYPLYLWHWPILAIITTGLGGVTPVWLRVGAIAVAACLAWCTWQGVEKPVKANLPRLSSVRMQVLVGFGPLAVVLLLGIWTQSVRGLPERVSTWRTLVSEDQIARNLGVRRWDEQHESIDSDCVGSRFVESSAVDYCRLTSSSPKVAVIGDSHANHLVPGLAALEDETLSRLVQTSFGGCAWFGDFVRFGPSNSGVAARCFGQNIRFVNEVLKDKDIKIVIFSYYYENLGASNSYYPASYINADNEISNYKSLNRLIKRLEDEGKRVVFIVDNPGFEFLPSSILYQRPVFSIFSTADLFSTPLDEVLRKQKELRTIVDKLVTTHPRLAVVDLPRLLCQKGNCPMIVRQKLMYRDENHLSLDGSILVGKLIQIELERQSVLSKDPSMR